jgi:hypothetical protein
LLREDNAKTKEYSVGYDVTDDVPINTLFEGRKELLSSLTGLFDLSELEKMIMSDVTAYYDLSEK